MNRIAEIQTHLIAAFAEAHPVEARALIDNQIAQTADPDRIADLELLREYLTNPEFREHFADFVANLTGS